MRLGTVLLVCACLLGSTLPAEQERTVVVWHEERVGGEWWVPFAVHGQPGVARCATPEEARRLYAVLAGVMVGGSSATER